MIGFAQPTAITGMDRVVRTGPVELRVAEAGFFIPRSEPDVQVSLHPALHAWQRHGWSSQRGEGVGRFPELVGPLEEDLILVGTPSVRYA